MQCSRCGVAAMSQRVAAAGLPYTVVASLLRRRWVTFTMRCKAASTSGQPRVFRPQSGFTHSRCAGITSSALCSSFFQLVLRRNARAVDVVYAGADFVGVGKAGKVTQQCHVRARGFDGNHVGVQWPRWPAECRRTPSSTYGCGSECCHRRERRTRRNASPAQAR